MIIKKEDELLDIAVRQKIIEAINGAENLRRKDKAYKAYQCYKDQTADYVRLQLTKQFDADTVSEMEWSISNIAFIRKVIDKLARVYKYGVERELWVDEAQLDEATEQLKAIADELDANRKFKKCNRYFKLFKNTPMYIRPKPVSDEPDSQKTIKMDPLPPYLYDVVELHDEREKAMAFVLSDYSPSRRGGMASAQPKLAVVPGTDGRGGKTLPVHAYKGDGVDQVIADTPGDEASGGYVFWSNKYHFVCDNKGAIISEGIDNPIEDMPFVNYAEDQDGSFWAIGGDDLVDGGVLVNAMITNILHIAITQGYGQLVMEGENLPRNVKTGPNKAVILERIGEAAPSTFDYKNSNPPLDQLRSLVEMYVALLLTTNNLSTSGVQSNLNGGASFASGIAMMIDKAESIEDVEDQRQIFTDNEPLVWGLYNKWARLLSASGELVEELTELPEDFDLRLQFGVPRAIESEKERLEVLKMKKDMGIISAIDMIKSEHPNLSDEEAEAKLRSILEEKIARAAAFGIPSKGEEEDESNGQQNNFNPDDSDDRSGDEEPIEPDEE